jgi:hypothetical protein
MKINFCNVVLHNVYVRREVSSIWWFTQKVSMAAGREITYRSRE